MRWRLQGLMAVVCLLIGAFSAKAGEREVPDWIDPSIDIHLMRAAIDDLQRGTNTAKQARIADIKARPELYAPPVLHVLSSVLYRDGEKNEAAFWFHLGQLRATFDVRRCADAGARQAVWALNQRFGGPIHHYTLQNVRQMEKLVESVIAFDTKTPYAYDGRWINLHGMKTSHLSAELRCMAKAEWPLAAEKNREEYRAGFRKAVRRR